MYFSYIGPPALQNGWKGCCAEGTLRRASVEDIVEGC